MLNYKNFNPNLFCDGAKFINKYHPGLYRSYGILETAYTIFECSPLTQRLFTKPPRVILRKVPNLINLMVTPKFSKKQIKNLV